MSSYVPGWPIETRPALPTPYSAKVVGHEARRRLLQEQLKGVELGAYDERIIAWLAVWDYETVMTVASLIKRARAAGTTADEAES